MGSGSWYTQQMCLGLIWNSFSSASNHTGVAWSSPCRNQVFVQVSFKFVALIQLSYCSHSSWPTITTSSPSRRASVTIQMLCHRWTWSHYYKRQMCGLTWPKMALDLNMCVASLTCVTGLAWFVFVYMIVAFWQTMFYKLIALRGSLMNLKNLLLVWLLLEWTDSSLFH